METSDLLNISVHKLWSITSKIVESMQILLHRFGSLRQLHELRDLHLQQAYGI